MTLNQIDRYFRSFLDIEGFPFDPSQNGIQIQNSAPDSKEITKAAFAVDACEESAIKAAECGAQILFVHHGVFWKNCEKLVGSFYKKIFAFIKNDLSLYACHLPLDANNPYGNNYGLAARLNLESLESFGMWHNMAIGVKGLLKKSCSLNEVSKAVLNSHESPLHILPFGKKEVYSVGIISGGAGEEVRQAVEQGLDLYITGEINHELFHYVKESKINVIAAGHYQTETIGVNLVKEKLEKETGIQTVFIDIPTGL